MSATGPIELADSAVADAAVFLNRLLRLDPIAVVRMVPGPPATVALWANLPWRVLATTVLSGTTQTDRTVSAAALLHILNRPDHPLRLDRRDADWRWALPPANKVRIRDRVAAPDLRQVGAAAAKTLTDVKAGGIRGRAVGARAVRDALLDHVSITVTTDDGELAIGQRLIQGVLRMGFLGNRAPEVVVLTAGAWLGLAGPHGTVWQRATRTLAITPVPGGQSPAGSAHS
jgi:hypothetical protein